jgi:transposase
MARPILSDETWKLIDVLLAERPRQSRTGRPALSNREALTGILFVLKTGISWVDLPREMGCGCGMTCWRRLRKWQRSGVWSRVEHILVQRLQEAHRYDWRRARGRWKPDGVHGKCRSESHGKTIDEYVHLQVAEKLEA